MKHPDLKIKSAVVKENSAYRVRIESWESIAPKGLIAVNFIQESLNKDGEVDLSSIYSYNMTREEINNLCKVLSEV
jgi:trehalose/maltose hydrolase-like predicted phosphorylase